MIVSSSGFLLPGEIWVCSCGQESVSRAGQVLRGGHPVGPSLLLFGSALVELVCVCV